ncbi:hypothetical protein E2C01_014692 [Portunus trituberculatus]|uniref:Uncharacterized protein n=1 Tax=Portunus trituberculatus TaxID=210409 RepID=A0A5B7DKV9_PORTR|nr:hypothetical protein [Portunus trituberculatus]
MSDVSPPITSTSSGVSLKGDASKPRLRGEEESMKPKSMNSSEFLSPNSLVKYSSSDILLFFLIWCSEQVFRMGSIMPESSDNTKILPAKKLSPNLLEHAQQLIRQQLLPQVVPTLDDDREQPP